MSTCFFIGHRDVSDSVLSALEQEVERHITEYGITDFVVGHYGRFDSLAAQALSRAKVRYPGIRLTLLLPYHPAEHLSLLLLLNLSRSLGQFEYYQFFSLEEY